MEFRITAGDLYWTADTETAARTEAMRHASSLASAGLSDGRVTVHAMGAPVADAVGQVTRPARLVGQAVTTRRGGAVWAVQDPSAIVPRAA